ncbi:MAG: hypothetical protein JNK05_36110 [Myxococcales bacterium]|nr:hypothetical protein [Myxococcales bacterium]
MEIVTQLGASSSRFSLTSPAEPAVQRVLEHETVVRVTPRAIYEWNASTGHLRLVAWFRTDITAHTLGSSVADVAVVLACGDVLVRDRSGVVWRWSRATGEIARPRIQAFSCSPDGTALAYDEGVDTVVVDSESYERIASFANPQAGTPVVLGHRGRWAWYYRDVPVQSGSEWCEFSLVETATGRIIERRALIGDLYTASMSADGLRVTIEERATRVIELDPSITPPRAPIVRASAWDELVAPIAGRPASDTLSAIVQQTFARLRYGTLRRVVCSDDERVAAAFYTGWNRWDLVGDALLFVNGALSTDQPERARATWSVALSKDGSRLATSSLDGVALWSTEPLMKIASLPAFPLLELAFDGDRALVGVMRDATAVRFDLREL